MPFSLELDVDESKLLPSMFNHFYERSKAYTHNKRNGYMNSPPKIGLFSILAHGHKRV